MAATPLSDSLAQEAVNVLAAHNGNYAAAAITMGTNRGTLQGRIRVAKSRGMTPNAGTPDADDVQGLKAKVKRLEADLQTAKKLGIDHTAVKNTIIKLASDATNLDPPHWLQTPQAKDTSPGVPALLVSDLHWGEIVDPKQIGGVNKYNMAIAAQRLQMLGQRAVKLLRIISPKMDYPGLVIPLAGDMVTGNLHDELTSTNEMQSMPVLLDLMGHLIALIDFMLGTFKRIHLPCVSGNHGRMTTKQWNKDRHATSFDWLLYQLLAKHYEKDARVTFQIPDGPDAFFRIYSHRYLLSHLDQFRGGDSMIGALGPLTRGDHKKRSRNGQIGMEYDTLVGGHWHQDIFLRKLIVNPSLKGYCEYAYNNNFSYEPPAQQLWITHQKHHITFRMPVYVDEAKAESKAPWISVQAGR